MALPSAQQKTQRLGIVAAVLIFISLMLVIFYAPRAQVSAGGDLQRIFYFHVSAAWLGFGAWIVTAFCGWRYLRTRDLRYDRIALATTEIGVVFIAMVMLTGMLWGKPVWNTWWTWEPKLTLSALQFLTYLAYLMLRGGIDDLHKRARFAAVYGIVGVLSVPLNFLVSRVLSNIHPAVFGPSVNAKEQGGFGIAPEMAITLAVCLVAFTLLYVYFLRARVAMQERADAIEMRRAELVAA